MVYYSLLHLSYILLTTAVSFKFVAAKHDLSSVQHRASDLCCVVSDCSLWPFLSLFDRLHLHVRGLTFSSTNIHAYTRSHIHVRLLSYLLTVFQEAPALVFLSDNSDPQPLSESMIPSH